MAARIEALTAAGTVRELAALAILLEDAVDSGASVGFLPPLDPDENLDYWRRVSAAVAGGTRVLLVARDATAAIVGAVQLGLATLPNAGHRAEVAKLMVHRRARRRGIGRALMLAVEGHARERGRTTLVLDTRQGDPAEALYLSLGYHAAGVVPRYARSAGGALHATVIYYRLLDTDCWTGPGERRAR